MYRMSMQLFFYNKNSKNIGNNKIWYDNLFFFFIYKPNIYFSTKKKKLVKNDLIKIKRRG